MPTCYGVKDFLSVWSSLPQEIRDIVTVVGDFSLCIHGVPCIARDIDFVLPVSKKPLIDEWLKANNIPHGTIVVENEGIGYVIESKINGVNVSFNIEPDERYKRRYKPDWIVRKAIDGTEVPVYRVERYLVSRMGRIAILYGMNRYRIPYEIMDIVPLACMDYPLDRLVLYEVMANLRYTPITPGVLEHGMIEAGIIMAGHLMDRYDYIVNCREVMILEWLRKWGLVE